MSQVYNTWRKEKDSHYCKCFVTNTHVIILNTYRFINEIFFISGDKNLLQSLVFDALVTDSLEKLTSQISKADKQ